MNLYDNTVSKFLLECLQKLMANATFNDFVLVGGTALSLQLGHRVFERKILGIDSRRFANGG